MHLYKVGLETSGTANDVNEEANDEIEIFCMCYSDNVDAIGKKKMSKFYYEVKLFGINVAQMWTIV